MCISLDSLCFSAWAPAARGPEGAASSPKAPNAPVLTAVHVPGHARLRAVTGVDTSGLLHVWEAERRDRWFGRASRGLGVPLTVACGLAAFPRSVRCTRAQSAGASQQRASRSEQALERERYTQLREGCRKSRRGRRSTVIDELAAAAARFAAQRAWYRAQQSNPLHPQGWHAWMWPLTSCSSCAVDVSH